MEKQMYHYAEICLPRKKKVWESFHSNTFRIFDEMLPERLDPAHVYQNHKCPGRDLRKSETHNVPHPHNARFIRTNVRFLNEPIAHMKTRHTETEQFNWWSDSPKEHRPVKPPYSKASTQRSDFQPIRDASVREQETNRPTATGITLHRKASQRVRVERRGGDEAQHIPEHRGVAFALGGDGKPVELLSAGLAFSSTDVGEKRGPSQSRDPRV
ncbi:hypothetical protein QQF64_003405 [Cirrhinus molitorella]|uniref:Domain of unknown function with conserved HDNR motif domain-containing protein n=1 Tax=Cirrhinus molitorella TaxID=172907 RepID=A0ABR3ML83_9TELE